MHAHWSKFRLEPRDWNDHTLPEPDGPLPLGIGVLVLFAIRAYRGSPGTTRSARNATCRAKSSAVA